MDMNNFSKSFIVLPPFVHKNLHSPLHPVSKVKKMDKNDILDVSYEESIAYFKRLKNLEKIKRTNGQILLHY
jgi:hypothetical protein